MLKIFNRGQMLDEMETSWGIVRNFIYISDIENHIGLLSEFLQRHDRILTQNKDGYVLINKRNDSFYYGRTLEELFNYTPDCEIKRLLIRFVLQTTPLLKRLTDVYYKYIYNVLHNYKDIHEIIFYSAELYLNDKKSLLNDEEQKIYTDALLHAVDWTSFDITKVKDKEEFLEAFRAIYKKTKINLLNLYTITSIAKKLEEATKEDEFFKAICEIGYEGCDVGLYIPLIKCEVPLSNEDICDFLEITPPTSELERENFSRFYQFNKDIIDSHCLFAHRDLIIKKVKELEADKYDIK